MTADRSYHGDWCYGFEERAAGVVGRLRMGWWQCRLLFS